jgi:hypothetical protein
VNSTVAGSGRAQPARRQTGQETALAKSSAGAVPPRCAWKRSSPWARHQALRVNGMKAACSCSATKTPRASARACCPAPAHREGQSQRGKTGWCGGVGSRSPSLVMKVPSSSQRPAWLVSRSRRSDRRSRAAKQDSRRTTSRAGQRVPGSVTVPARTATSADASTSPPRCMGGTAPALPRSTYPWALYCRTGPEAEAPGPARSVVAAGAPVSRRSRLMGATSSVPRVRAASVAV